MEAEIDYKLQSNSR
jgi:Gram-negative bacterial TonB protein C-terminal